MLLVVFFFISDFYCPVLGIGEMARRKLGMVVDVVDVDVDVAAVA